MRTGRRLLNIFMNLTQVLLWLVASTAVLGLGHVYLWRRLIRDASLPRGWERFATGGMLLFLLAQPAVFVLGRSLPREEVSPWAFTTFVWMGLVSSFLSLLVLTDIARLGVRVLANVRGSGARTRLVALDPVGPTEERLDRRSALGRLVAGGVVVGGGALTSAGVAQALGDFTVKRLTVELDKLPLEFDGFRIVQLSDVHVGPTIGRAFIEHMVDVTNAEAPDLVAITGDLVDGSVEHLRKHTEPLRDIKSQHGTFFVTGNHEYYSGAEDWVRELTRLGITVLSNRRVSIERAGAAFDLAGVTDHRAGRYGDAPDLQRALSGRDPGRELVLLAHQPAAIHEASEAGVGLQLSGHTHGGQFWPWNWVVHLIQPVVAGLARFGPTQIYVSCGTGYWGPPVRVGTESEITVVTLKAARREALASIDKRGALARRAPMTSSRGGARRKARRPVAEG